MNRRYCINNLKESLKRPVLHIIDNLNIHTLSAFSPNWFVNISGRALAKKLEALDTYITEMRAFPHARSVKALEYLAKWRGASIGCEAAEGFMLGRQIT